MPRLVSRAEFARLAGVSKPAVTKASKGPLLQAACSADRIDVDHPDAVAYVAAATKGRKGGASAAEQTDRAPTKTPKSTKAAPRAPTPPAKPGRKRAAKPPAPPHPPPPPPPPTVPAEGAKPLDAYAQMLDELVTEFGTARNFRDWLQSRKMIADIREKELKIDEAEGRLIRRDLVMTHLLGLIEGAFRQLLTDTPKKITRTMYAMARSDSPLEEAEARTRAFMSEQLEPLRDHAVRVLE